MERVSAVLKLFDAHFGDRFGLYLKRRKLEETEWRRLESLDPNAQLYFELPRLFALDLNAALANSDDRRSGLQPATAANRGLKPAPSSPPREAGHNRPARIVLLFDTHEAFWGVGRVHESSASYFLADEWLRRLLRALDLDKGIVAVVAGREPPRWADAPINPQDGKATALPSSNLDTQLIGHLKRDDADEYLQKAGVADATLRQALVRQAEVAPDQVHPLYVGLCGDIALLAAQQGQPLDPTRFAAQLETGRSGLQPATDPAKALVERLLRYCHADLANAVKALAAARAFDRELFFALGEKLHYHATEASYQCLMGFSFVWPSKKGEGWGRIHDLLRRVLWEIDEEQMAQADAVLEDWFRARHATGDEAAIVEAIYHANRREWERGYVEWHKVFEPALQNARYVLCASLLELRPEFWLETDFAQGLLAYDTGEFALALSQHATAQFHLQESVVCYDRALQQKPDDIEAHNNRGNALLGLAGLLAGLAEYGLAKESYRQAIAAYDEALRRAPDLIAAHNNRGNALTRLAALLAGLTEHGLAWESYQQAIATYDEALRRAPELIQAHNNRGNALTRLAALLAGLTEHGLAWESYQQAIAAYDEALRRAPDYVGAHMNRGNALQGLAGLLAEHAAARETYGLAIAAYDEALRRAPDYVDAHSNRGMALNQWAKHLSELGELPAAQQTNAQAMEACRRALALAPKNPTILWTMTGAQMLAAWLETLNHGAAAPALWRAALQTIEQGLSIVPDHPQLLQLRQEAQDALRQAPEPPA